MIVFEHTSLFVDKGEIRQEQLDALEKYNNLHGSKYFKIGNKKVTFTSYVGVIQVGNLIIEVLPKADRKTDDNSKNKWRGVLLTMLANAGLIKLNITEHAALHIGKMKLLDIYLYTFLQETSQLIHAGLFKRYRRKQGNSSAFKGGLLLDKHLQQNLIHKERFYTQHSTYDKNHTCNQVLKKSLQIIYDTSFNNTIRSEAARLLLDFEGIDEWKGDELVWDKLTFDRKSLPYQNALELAKLIIFGYCPDFRAGKSTVIALLFDMNLLFERYVYRSLKKAETLFNEYKLSIDGQNRVRFWAHKSIKPDIIVSFYKPEIDKIYRCIIDTKWKIVEEGYPADADLKQLYVYNMQLNADHAILFYPFVGQQNQGGVPFAQGLRSGFSHSCEMYYGQLFDNSKNNLNKNFAREFISYLIEGEFVRKGY